VRIVVPQRRQVCRHAVARRPELAARTPSASRPCGVWASGGGQRTAWGGRSGRAGSPSTEGDRAHSHYRRKVKAVSAWPL